MKKNVFLILALLGSSLISQNSMPANNYTVQNWWNARPPVTYPQVGSDRRITFQISAPRATDVKLVFGEWKVKPMSMNKNDAGVWGITIGPVVPNIYQYTFQVDGVSMVDLGNPNIKTGQAVDASVVDVPGDPPRFDQWQDVPHGMLHYMEYQSTSLHRPRGLSIYVPPDYRADGKQTYPVLYLRHGGGDNEMSWARDGKAGVILDNLLAKRQSVPMLIVMTDGMIDGTWASSSSPAGIKLLDDELINDVIPLVEKNYHTQPKAIRRAIAGLSMGGGQAFIIGLNHPRVFSWTGEFSSGLLSDAKFDLESSVPGVGDAVALNNSLSLLWLGCGTDDPRYPGQRNLNENLNKRGIKHEFHESPGGHEWQVWRLQLHDFLEKLFKEN